MSDDICETHTVFNQPLPLADYNLFTADRVLSEAFAREGLGHSPEPVIRYGEIMGRAETIALGFDANRFPPILKAFDRFGHRRDEVEFHPSWHALMRIMIAHGLHARPWTEPIPGTHVARAACYILHAQVEAGTQCPTTMTYGAIPLLARDPDLAQSWLPKLTSRDYDHRFIPAGEKTGALVGMGMTEKQGGSDVRANTTRAEPINGTGREYRIIGHKWFFSAPMCDAFLVLAQAKGGLSCFFMPRFRPDGTLNAIRIQRLKDKLGNRSNASSEVEFTGAYARLLGEEGRGVATILEMGTYTRLDCALGTAGMMRQAVAQAIHHARHRAAFGKPLADQPLMRNVLADLALESEAATMLVMRLARAFDRQSDPRESLFRRIVTPVVKYFVCKRGPVVAAEAMEVLGGGGYVEESIMPRIYREMPLNSIWEGSGNIMCLDMLRAVQKSADAAGVLVEELDLARGEARLDAFVEKLKRDFAKAGEASARTIAERLALALQAGLMLRFAPSIDADAFIASRIAGSWSGSFGTLAASADLGAIIDRAAPKCR